MKERDISVRNSAFASYSSLNVDAAFVAARFLLDVASLFRSSLRSSQNILFDIPNVGIDTDAVFRG